MNYFDFCLFSVGRSVVSFEQQGFIDPNLCDEPEKLLLDLSREFFPEQIQFAKDSDPGNCVFWPTF